MINYTKDINAKYGSPYVEVEETTDGATKANNGKYYLTKEQIESRFTDGDFHLVYLQDAEFIPPPPPAPWNKEAHIAEINALHSQEFKRRYLALDYEDGWDVHLYAKSSELGFQEEAQELLKYWTDGFAAIIAYGETVTEETAQDPIVFVSSI
jgi:hypothetical protein